MKENEYIMVGAPIITREVFRSVLRPLNNYGFKPSGGFWSSIHTSNIGNISEWYTYLLDARGIARNKNLNQSTIFTLKDNAKILIIDTPEKILELAKKYPSYHHTLGFYEPITDKNRVFDFEKLSQDYDGIYINFNVFINQFKTIVFDKFSTSSLLLFNLDCIKEYQSAPIIFDIDNPYSFPYIKPDTISVSQTVEEESYEHKILAKLTEELYLSLIDNHSFRDYDEYLTTITQNVKTVISIIEKNNQKKVTEIVKFLESKGMMIKQGQIIQNLVLNFLSEYLINDEERIKSLPKSKVRTPKTYSII